MSAKAKRLISLIAAVCMIIAMVPIAAYAANPGTLTTDIGEKTFVVGVTTEFSFTTTANDDLGKMVIGTSNFSDADAIEKLEYYEVNDGKWYEFKGDFGPSTGFPMSDATSKFRITFKEAGDYTFTASMKEVATGDELCSVNVSFTVSAEDETDPTTPVEPTTPEDPTAPEDPTTPDEPTTPDQPTAPADDTTVPVDDTAPADDTAPVDDTTAPADDSADSDKPQTGDSSNLAFWIVLLVISAGGLAAVIFFERKYKLF